MIHLGTLIRKAAEKLGHGKLIASGPYNGNPQLYRGYVEDVRVARLRMTFYSEDYVEFPWMFEKKGAGTELWQEMNRKLDDLGLSPLEQISAKAYVHEKDGQKSVKLTASKRGLGYYDLFIRIAEIENDQ